MKILAIYAHPADVGCEAFGTLLIHRMMGNDVHHIIVTDGEDHHNVIHTNIPYTKRCEAKEICRFADFESPLFLCMHDRRFEIGQLHLRIADLLDIIKPTLVVTHMPITATGIRGEHEVIGEAVRRATIVSKHKPHQIYYFPMDDSLDSIDMLCRGIVCDVWVDTTSVITKKLQAINLIKSQGYGGRCARKIIEARDGRWGMLAGCSYAEPFLRARAQTYRCLPHEPPRRIVPNNLPGDDLLEDLCRQ